MFLGEMRYREAYISLYFGWNGMLRQYQHQEPPANALQFKQDAFCLFSTRQQVCLVIVEPHCTEIHLYQPS
jgi:hypothetical protein